MEGRGDSGHADMLVEHGSHRCGSRHLGVHFPNDRVYGTAGHETELGELPSVLAEALGNMDAEMGQFVRVGAPTANVADLRQRVGAWADAHPIKASLVGRQ